MKGKTCNDYSMGTPVTELVKIRYSLKCEISINIRFPLAKKQLKHLLFTTNLLLQPKDA